MKRSDKEVAKILKELYSEKFSGKKRQRFLISKENLRKIYPIGRIEEGRFYNLQNEALEFGLYIFELGHISDDKMIGVIKSQTVDRWRTVPLKIAKKFAA